MEILVSKLLETLSRRQGNILLLFYRKINGENALEYNKTAKSKGIFQNNHDPRPGSQTVST